VLLSRLEELALQQEQEGEGELHQVEAGEVVHLLQVVVEQVGQVGVVQVVLQQVEVAEEEQVLHHSGLEQVEVVQEQVVEVQ